MFNQAAHQVDIVRLLGGGRVEDGARRDRRLGRRTRPTEGAYSALLTFEDGAFASLTYGGYGNFDSDEFQGWIGEMGQAKTPYAREPLIFASIADEAAFKNARNYGGAAYQPADRARPRASAFRHDRRELRARRPAPDADRRDDLPERCGAPRSAAVRRPFPARK